MEDNLYGTYTPIQTVAISVPVSDELLDASISIYDIVRRNLLKALRADIELRITNPQEWERQRQEREAAHQARLAAEKAEQDRELRSRFIINNWEGLLAKPECDIISTEQTAAGVLVITLQVLPPR